MITSTKGSNEMSNVLSGGKKRHFQGRGVSKSLCGKKMGSLGMIDKDEFLKADDDDKYIQYLIKNPELICAKCKASI